MLPKSSRGLSFLKKKCAMSTLARFVTRASYNKVLQHPKTSYTLLVALSGFVAGSLFTYARLRNVLVSD